MTLKTSTWRKNLTLGSKQVTRKTPTEWRRTYLLQRKQMDRGCSQGTSSFPHNRYSDSHIRAISDSDIRAIRDSDIRAAQYAQEFCYTRQVVLDEVQLQHPIAYDNFTLCDMHKERSLKTLSIAMLKIVCEYFGVCTNGFHAKSMAEYISASEELIKACSCYFI